MDRKAGIPALHPPWRPDSLRRLCHLRGGEGRVLKVGLNRTGALCTSARPGEPRCGEASGGRLPGPRPRQRGLLLAVQSAERVVPSPFVRRGLGVALLPPVFAETLMSDKSSQQLCTHACMHNIHACLHACILCMHNMHACYARRICMHIMHA